MSEKIDQIVEELKTLTLLEAAELVSQIEETFGVDASAAVGGPVVMAAAGAAEEVEEKTEFRINNINVDGIFNNGEYNRSSSSEIIFKSFDASMESNSFSGDFKLMDLVNPYIELNMDTELKFSEIKEIFLNFLFLFSKFLLSGRRGWQLKSLGRSGMAKKYGITGLQVLCVCV